VEGADHMKVLMTPIEILAWFTKNGIPHPLKFKYLNERQEEEVIKIDKILNRWEEKFAGKPTLVFHCQSEFRGTPKLFDIKYELHTSTWFLYRM